jgi:vancomycin permeability regulator SanA
MALTYIVITILFLLIVAGFLFMRINIFVKVLLFGILFAFVPFVGIIVGNGLLLRTNEILYAPKAVIVVLGAGIKNNEIPSDILKLRLNSGLEIYKSTGQKLIVTGDNSLDWHNEPRVMKNYLIKNQVESKDITEDFGGRRTMDSCYRVKNFFGAKKIILVTQAFHISRAKFLCESVGLEVETKIAADTGPNTVIWGYIREVPAAWSALIDSIYFKPQIGSNGLETLEDK